MYGTERALSNRYGAEAGGKPSIRRQGLLLFGLILPLLVGGLNAHSADQFKDTQSLEQALKESRKALSRFHLQNGQSIVGRFIKLDAEMVIIRRPAGGLRSVPIADIGNVEIADSDGNLVRGWLLPLDDGEVGWTKNDPHHVKNKAIASATTNKPTIETGGPLIKVQSDEKENLLVEAAPVVRIDKVDDENGVGTDLVQDVAIDGKQLAALSPTVDENGDASSRSASVHLNVRADEVSETENIMLFRLSLSEPAQKSIVIIYSILDGTAVADADYKHRQGVLVFAPGETQKALAIEIIDDDDVEDAETFQLFVTADPNAVVIDTRTVEASIQDNDS